MGKTTNFDLEKAAEQRKAEMKDITEKLEKGVQDVFSSEQFQNLLDTMAKFPHYSVNNNILTTRKQRTSRRPAAAQKKRTTPVIMSVCVRAWRVSARRVLLTGTYTGQRAYHQPWQTWQ